MNDFYPRTTREKILVERERKRVFELEGTLKRAINIATKYKDSYESELENRVKIQKEMATLKKGFNIKTNSDKIGVIISELDAIGKKLLRVFVRKGLHPDKHQADPGTKKTLGHLLDAIEEYFE